MNKKILIALAADIKWHLDNFTGSSDETCGAEARASAQAKCALICRIAPQFNPNFDQARFVKACGL